MSDDSLQNLTSLLSAVFSTVILTAIGVIISGKLMAKRLPFHLSGGDKFSINLGVLRLQSGGDEVAWGFIMFMLALATTICFGGKDAYQYFAHQSGIDLGQWRSLCAIASFISMLVSLVVWTTAPLFRSSGVISNDERRDQISKLSANSNEN